MTGQHPNNSSPDDPPPLAPHCTRCGAAVEASILGNTCRRCWDKRAAEATIIKWRKLLGL
ncbi:MAG: hypothetical protein ACREV4_15590 [Gammaproteobacteria bacterium]